MENLTMVSFPQTAIAGELGRLYKHQEYMKEAFEVISIDDAQKGSLGFIGGLYGAKAIYTRLALMELRGMNDFVKFIHRVK